MKRYFLFCIALAFAACHKDTSGRLLRIQDTYPNIDHGVTDVFVKELAYDGHGRVVKTSARNLASLQSAPAWENIYFYDGAGRCTRMEQPSGDGVEMAEVYHYTGNLHTRTDHLNIDPLTQLPQLSAHEEFFYNNGRLLKQELFNWDNTLYQTIEYTTNPDGSVAGKTYKDASGQVTATETFTYTAFPNPASFIPGLADVPTFCFETRQYRSFGATAMAVDFRYRYTLTPEDKVAEARAGFEDATKDDWHIAGFEYE